MGKCKEYLHMEINACVNNKYKNIVKNKRRTQN